MASGLTRFIFQTVVGLSFLAAFLAPAYSAPILGETQQSQAPGQTPDDQIAAEPATPAATPTIVSAKATVLEFSILQSPGDPDVFETTIILRQGGGSQVCLNHASQDIIVRSYETQADPFTPDIPSTIAGRRSGDVGEIAGFNSEKVFIRPSSDNDKFDSPSESFTVGGFEGVFKPDEGECDQELIVGEPVCIDAAIRTGDCAFTQHASLARQLRLTLALNSVSIIAPAAGLPVGEDAGPVIGPGAPGGPGGGLPTGPGGAAPTFPGPGGGSGGGGLLTIPNVIGLPLSNAMSVITADGFTVGAITASQGDNTGLFNGIFVSTALAQSALPPGLTGDSPVISQAPPGGTQAAALTPVNLVGQADDIPVPEPSTLSLFALGLLLALAMYGYSRVRSRRAVGRA